MNLHGLPRLFFLSFFFFKGFCFRFAFLVFVRKDFSFFFT